MKICIVGNRGGMGRWFTVYFRSRGHRVTGYDLAEVGSPSFREILARRHDRAEVALIAVPIPEVPDAIRRAAEYMAAGSILVEISSVKRGIDSILARAGQAKEIRPLSVHPLFGPGSDIHRHPRMILARLKDEADERRLFGRVFPGSRPIVLSVEEHDRLMSILLSLTHFVNVAFAGSISRSDLRLLEKIGLPSYTLQMVLAQSIMQESGHLVSSILLANPHTAVSISNFISTAERILDLLKDRNEEGLVRELSIIRESLKESRGFRSAYGKKYAMLKKISE